MAILNNPVARLVDAFDEAKKTVIDPNTPLKTVWAKVFSISSNDNSQILFAYGKLIDLVREAKQSVERLQDVDKELYLKPFSSIEKAFQSLPLEANWQSFTQIVNENTMLGLRYAADKLERLSPSEKPVDHNQLAELLSIVQNLMEDVLRSDLDPQLRTVIADNLEAIRRAIIEYRIRGVAGLRAALDSTLGAIIRHKEQVKAQEKNPIVQRFYDIMVKLDTVVSLASNTTQLVAPATGAILKSIGMGS